LEADAFRLRVHVWSGVVVLFGLACARAAECFPAWGDLRHGDAVAAFIMAGLFAGTGLKLGYQAAQGLLDAAPEGAIDAIHRALAPLAGVALCGPVRARRCGAHVYVDVHAAMNGRLTLREAHELSDAIEARIRAFLPGAEVTVHPEPAGMMGGGPGREVSKHG
jgi:divalent metal cation (Fe/Co/Zn/Cd) transporter